MSKANKTAPVGPGARDAEIVRASAVGIAANVVLAAFKALAGAAAGSMAMVLDAVNNLSDALSSVITIAGTKLAARKPDKKHPLGYGRVEYLTSMSISAIVLYAGVTAFVEAVKGILHPTEPAYSPVALAVIAVSVAAKLALGRYVKGVGRRVGSGSLAASAQDAVNDALLSAAVLLSALLFLFAHVNLEAWVSVVISVFIIKAGVEMLRDSADEVLGKRLAPETARAIRQTVCEDEDVMGAYDLILHSYGPEKLIGSLHVEVADTMSATQIDRMERRIAERVLEKHGVLLAGIGIYSYDHSSDDMRDRIFEIVRRHDGVLQIHGFFADEARKRAGFDLVLDYALKDRQETFRTICEEVRAAFPDYAMQITMDIDI